jgi:hypothetical protein
MEGRKYKLNKSPHTNQSTYSAGCIGYPRVQQGFVLGPLLFLTHVNDLLATDSHSKPITYAGDISITIAYPDLVYLQNIKNDVSETEANGLKTTNWH